MKNVMRMMTVYMGVTMSLVLSLVGTLLGGHFTFPSWIVSFLISLVISLVIGFIVPIKKVGDMACKKCNVNPESMKGNLVSGLVSDLIYTPIITIVMVTVMVNSAIKHLQAAGITEHLPSVGKVMVPSLIVCFIVGYFVIIIMQPIYIKMLLKKAGMQK